MKMTRRNRQKFRRASIEQLEHELSRIDAGCGYEDWFRVLAAIKYESGASNEGFALANQWSSEGHNYQGTKDVERYWRYIDINHPTPITIGTLKRMAQEGKGKSGGNYT
jgi:hypothetical protein